MDRLSTPTLLLFACTALALLAAWVWGILRSSGPKLVPLTALGLWLAAIGVSGGFGFFERFDTLPPRLILVILPMLGVMAWLSFSKAGKGWATHFSSPFLMGVQVFRVAVEWFLYRAYAEGQLPVEMTFDGHNFDIVVGLTAPLAALLAYINAARFRRLLIGWNVSGMVILSVVVTHGVGGAPTRIQWLHLTPDNTLIGVFPYIYLPAFLVLSAYVLHILALRRLTAPLNRPSSAV